MRSRRLALRPLPLVLPAPSLLDLLLAVLGLLALSFLPSPLPLSLLTLLPLLLAVLALALPLRFLQATSQSQLCGQVL